MTEVGGAAHTIDLCKQRYKRRLKQGEQPVEAVRWRELMEQNAFRVKLWVASGVEQYLRRMWEHFTVKRPWANSVLSAETERQEGVQGNGQNESPLKQELEPVKRISDLSFMVY